MSRIRSDFRFLLVFRRSKSRRYYWCCHVCIRYEHKIWTRWFRYLYIHVVVSMKSLRIARSRVLSLDKNRVPIRVYHDVDIEVFRSKYQYTWNRVSFWFEILNGYIINLRPVLRHTKLEGHLRPRGKNITKKEKSSKMEVFPSKSNLESHFSKKVEFMQRTFPIGIIESILILRSIDIHDDYELSLQGRVLRWILSIIIISLNNLIIWLINKFYDELSDDSRHLQINRIYDKKSVELYSRTET